MSIKTLGTLPNVTPLLSATTAPLIRAPHASLVGTGGFLKRLIDVVGALVGLTVLWPVMLLVALAIRLDSAGPVIFAQRRVGLNGREFRMLKFRSMVVDAEERRAELLAHNEVQDGITFKIARDPRITRVGRFIRKTSLDEFPQLLNILLGDMSLVGPRPPLPGEVARYSREQWERLTVMPGATGLWQVSGRSNLATFAAMVGLDLDYIHQWSLWLDLRILLRTFKVIVRMEGSC